MSMNKIHVIFFYSTLIFVTLPVWGGEEKLIFSSHSTSSSIEITSWKTLRDSRIVKQDLDYSCGAASLATLLNEFYGQDLTEEELLEAMDKGDMRASFDDMQRALPSFGFRAIGYAANYDQLVKLKIPVIVYMKHRKNDHFSVLRGIDESTVWLADSSLGNRTYSRTQFLRMWETRSNEADYAELKGKILAILPATPKMTVQSDFFTRTPKRQTAQVIQRLSVRHVQ